MFENHPVFLLMEIMMKLGRLLGVLLDRLGLLRKDNVTLAKLITALPSSVAQFITLGKGDNPLADWYHNNGIYKFPIGTSVALNNIRNFGYGVRPVGVVVGYTEKGGYEIQMEFDENGNFYDWINGRCSPCGKRQSEKEFHFKWNIEYLFKAIPRPDVEIAYQ